MADVTQDPSIDNGKRAGSPLPQASKRPAQQESCVAYFIAYDTFPGKLDPVRAEALGVPKCEYARIKMGQSVCAFNPPLTPRSL